jgi:hypothetical protein
MMDVAIRAAARPGRRRLVHRYAALAGVTSGLVIGLAAQVPARIPADAMVVTVTAPVRGRHDHVSGDRAAQSDDRARLLAGSCRVSELARGLATLPVCGAGPETGACGTRAGAGSARH